MDEIELVVKMPEDVYRYAKKYNGSSMLTLREKEIGMCMNAIANGIPLPKGHGDLIDVDTMRKYQKIEQIAREGKNETRCEEIVRIIDGKA